MFFPRCARSSVDGAVDFESEKTDFPKGWAEMISEVYEVNPMVCRQCGGRMKVITFLIDFGVADKIIDHLKLSFSAERHLPLHIARQEMLMAAETSAEYFC